MKIKNLRSYDIFMDNFEKFCYDNGEVDKYKYILMLNKSEEELESFYPDDEIVKDYGEALMKYKSKGFIYPFTHDEEQAIIHNTEKQLAYDEGVEQKELDVIKNMLKLNLPISTIAKSINVEESKVEKIIKENNLDK